MRTKALRSTRQEKLYKMYITGKLRRQGYNKYAEILKYIPIHLLPQNFPGIAFWRPSSQEIFINPYINKEAVSVVIRHEILHMYLQHELRLIRKFATENGFDPNKLTDLEFDDLRTKVYFEKVDQGVAQGHGAIGQPLEKQPSILNIAGDYEISNKGYTEKDKEMLRSIMLNGELVGGLITEDDHPDWVNLSLEEMYDEIRKLKEEDKSKPHETTEIAGILLDPTKFVDVYGNVYGA